MALQQRKQPVLKELNTNIRDDTGIGSQALCFISKYGTQPILGDGDLSTAGKKPDDSKLVAPKLRDGHDPEVFESI